MMKNGIIWLASMAVAVMSGFLAMGAVAKDKAPQLAMALYPTNGFAAENMASNILTRSVAANAGQFPTHVDPAASKFARIAFVAEPVTPEAAAILALGLDDSAKHKLMSEALSLSRRQPLITAWMILDSGARNDLAALLNHYDTMLRTSPSAGPVVLPLLADTLKNDNFLAPFAEILDREPPWAYLFWGAVVSKPEAIGNAARLREMVYRPNEDRDIYSDGYLIRALVNNQQFAEAESLYRLLVGEEKPPAPLTNASFATAPEYAPIDWQLFSTGEYGAIVNDGRLELSAIRDSGGLFARQLVKLPRSMVKMDVRPAKPIPDNAKMIISLKCAQQLQNAPQAIRIPLTGKISNLQIDNAKSGCSYYWLDIEGKASDNGDGFDIALDSVSLR